MGYTTEFRGSFELNKKLDATTHTFLNKLNETRRMSRNLGPEFGTEGEFFVDGRGHAGQDHEASIIDYNSPPSTQPGLWCQWRPTESGTAIEWDGGDKFYNYIPWIQYIISNVLEPKGYILNGEVAWRGEDWSDTGNIIIRNNILTFKGRPER